MKEIGGYMELDTYLGDRYHEAAISLNCGRNCLAYLVETKQIKKLALPYFLCGSVYEVCKRYGVELKWYHIDTFFQPEDVAIAGDEWIYIVNYYGQLTQEKITELVQKYGRVIVDNAQAFFQMPVTGVDTLYSCRKFIGVPDGAYLYTDCVLNKKISLDESFERMRYLLGRYERTASEFYAEYVANNKMFASEPIKRMSRLTENLLKGIDYETLKKRRTENFSYLHKRLGKVNRLCLTVPEGAFMYPLYTDKGRELRQLLKERKIYVPVLWPDVFELCESNSLEYDLAMNILPLPVDQRYGIEEMKYIAEVVGSV